MRLIGSVASVLATLVAGRVWRGLRLHLATAYGRYCASVRSRLPASLVGTLIAAEDPRFHRHRGIDPIGFVRAIWRLRLARTLLRGGTIEHRLVRLLAARYAPGRVGTVRTILLAALVDTVVPKAEIPGLYLSVAHFGWEMDGVQQACRRLGFDLARLTPLQTAAIVARLRYPEPEVVSFKRAHRIAVRAQHVLRIAARQAATGASADGAQMTAPVG